MNLSALFIRRPVMTTLAMLSILLFGIIGYRLLPVSDLPTVDFPTIQVNASLPGANPDTMSAAVATPIEKELSTIAGIDSMSSSSSQGYTQITLQFVLDRDIDAAAQDVQSALARAARRMPPEMTVPPSYRKVNPADQPIVYLTLTSPTVPMSQLDEFGQTLIAQRVSMLDGVAQVQVYGGQKYAVRIQLDPLALATRGIGIDEVADAITQANVNMPLGILSGANKATTLQANGQLNDAQAYLPLIVAFRDGRPVRLSELGTAKDGVENVMTAAWYYKAGAGQRAIVLAVQKQPGTNTVAVARSITALLPEFREKLPAAVTLDVLRDNSVPIEESVRDVELTLLLTLLLVVLVIFLFLRNLSATVIPSVTLPMAIVGTFGAMYLLGYSLDNLSLMALTLSVGFVVDDAIVMLENIVRHMEMGKPRLAACFDGSKEIAFTIVSMTISLAAVFIPVLFLGGIVGRLFREFSVTIGVAVLVSGVVSLTLTPMLSSRFLRDPRAVRHGWAYKVTEAGFTRMLRAYDRSLSWVLGHRSTTMVFSAGVLAATFWLFSVVPKGFLPSEDRDSISISTEASQDTSFDAMVGYQIALADILKKDPNVDRFMSNAGVNSGRFNVVLKPRAQRKLSADEVIQALRPKLAAIPGVRSYLTNPPPISVGGRSTRSLYQLTLQGTDTDDLFRFASRIEEQARQMPTLTDVSSDLSLKNPTLNVQIDRDKARFLGLHPLAIETALYDAYGSRQVSTIMAPNNQYQVILELLPKYQVDASLLSLLSVRSNTGQLVPLSAMTTLREDVGPLTVNHTGQLPSVTISFNLRPGVSLGQALESLSSVVRAGLPSGVSFGLQGTAQAFQSSLSSMGVLLVLAVAVIYIVLGILYESFYHPITILSALPFAGLGALLTLLVFKADLSIYAFVGIIMLVGLVKKNGIMMVDFAIEAQKDGASARDAIHRACVIRFRPIMMTTMAALMAGLPIALGWGAGAESRRPLGLAVVGGLIFSQTLTLYVTPVFYVIMERFRVWLSAKLGSKDGAVSTA
jgi:hydrophobic/amphiphilic exporter-1 (mainly G- bacteria), HAE1 family